MTERGLAGGLTNYGDAGFAAYLRRSFARSMGYSGEMLRKPVVGITWTASGFNNCHRGVPELVEAVKRGVLSAGALPLDFPVISLGEVFLTPTSLMFRNLMAMDVEEMVRAQPMDAVVLVGGCDKTVPALLMGAASAGKPAILCVTGPMMTGRHRGERLGACTDCRRFWAQYRAGTIDSEGIDRIEENLATTEGTCAVMGTASTMAILAETMGLTLPDTAAIPAVHADRLRAAEATGRRAVELIGTDLTVDRIVTAPVIENALRVLLAVGGSTNAVVHLTAIAGRLGLPVPLDLLNRLSDETPTLVDLKPTGQHYMEDFHAAGGVPAVLARLADRAAPRRPHDHRRDARRAHRRRRPVGERRDHPPAGPAHPGRGRARRAVRHARAERRHPEARRRRRRGCSSARAGPWSSRRWKTWRGASTIPRSTCAPRTSSSCRTPARARAGCRRRATCPSRPSSRARA